MKGRHHFARKAVDTYHLPNWVFDAKQLFFNCTADRADVSRSIHIILREYGTLIDVPSLYVEVFWRNAAVGRVPILIAIDDLYWIIHIRRNALDERNLVLDGYSIGHDQRLRVMRTRAHTVDRAAASLNPDKVVSKIIQ